MHRADWFKLVTFDYDVNQILKNHNLEPGGKVQQYIDSNVLKYCEPKVPKDGNALIESGINNTNIGSGEVVYYTPYARRWYYMPANFQEAPTRDNYWFERMKAENRKTILEGAAREAGAHT